ncbi:MAG: glucose-6-phosphate dehydrogenase, partial [Lentisphaerae bacterium]|nr:glucose-6-phosphate dehydrogenase [Lentisphaerota bacterium]
VAGIKITWKENIGVEDRGGYFDKNGIIRDVMQNHLLQILALIAMEPPKELNPDEIKKEKARLIKCIEPVTPNEILNGQYTRPTEPGLNHNAYREEHLVPPDSRTCTYAAASLTINNERWKDVPVIMSAGKALDTNCTEIRIFFRKPDFNSFVCHDECPDANELIIRVQPGESIKLKITSKTPGLHMKLQNSQLDLNYLSAFKEKIPEAYELLLLDVIRGDHSLFISSEELAASWDVFTTALDEMEADQKEPVLYPFGTCDRQLLEVLLNKLGLPAFLID